MKTSATSAKVLSPQERERLQRQVDSLEASLRGQFEVPRNRRIQESGLSEHKKGYFNQFMRDDVREDKSIIEARLKRVKQVLERGTPQPLSRSERAKADKQMQEDREWLKRNLASQQLFHAKRGTPEFERGMQAVARERDPRFQRVADRYIQNLRRLDPNNVERNHLERLRPSS